MLSTDKAVIEIAARFGIIATHVVPIEASGFSGAGVWRIATTQGQTYCVKRFGELTADHLAWIHRVLLHTIVCDCEFVARPQRTADGMSFTQTRDGLWEVSTWMPGEAHVGSTISNGRLSHAMHALARFHQSAAQVNFDFRPSPGVTTRLDQLANMKATLASAQMSSLKHSALKNLAVRLSQFPPTQLNRFADALGQFKTQTLPLQPVIRDLRSDHLLFTGDQLTGLIDFDAMQMETIALDLTRCLGSLVPDNVDRWQYALEAYANVRPIQRAELELIKILDPINVILSAVNWIQWIAIDQRHFKNAAAVDQRLTELNQRLDALLDINF